MTHHSHNSHRRPGFTIIEASIALVLLVAAAALLLQFTLTATAVQRQTWRRQLLGESLANLAEELHALPWDELTAEKISARELPAEVRDEFPQAKLQAIVRELEGPIAGRQIDLAILPNDNEPPQRLTLWRFRAGGQP
jgi:hypothetical protein